MAATTLGHIAVVGVSSGVEVVMAALGDHLVGHSVAYLLEEHLVGSRCDAGGALALDHPSYHLLGQGRASAANKREEHYYHRHGYHHRYPGAHLFLLRSVEKGLVSALGSPLSVSPPRTLIAASGTPRIPQIRCFLLFILTKCIEGKLSEGCIRHPA